MNQCLSIVGMKFFSHHGYYKEEKEKGGNYLVNVDINTNLDSAGQSDNLSDTINYEEVYSITKSIMEVPHHLIESLAYEIAHEIKEKFSQIEKLKVVVSKLNPPIEGEVDRTSITYTLDDSNDNTSSNYWQERAKY